MMGFGKSPPKSFTEKQKKIADLIIQKRLQQVIVLKPSVTRNVMFVGRARCGKSTVFKVLKDPAHVTQQLSIFRGTVEPSLFSFTVEKTFDSKEDMQQTLQKVMTQKQKKAISNSLQSEMNGDEEYDKLRADVKEYIESETKRIQMERNKSGGAYSINFNINIIDTPGLFEAQEKEELTRDNKTIKETILQCMRREIKQIHAIFFVCSFTTGVMEQDVKAFKQFLQLFKGAEKNIALLVTRCESITNRNRKKIVEQITEDVDLKGIFEKVNERLFFSGAIPHTAVENDLVDRVELALTKVGEMRNNLFEFIFSINEPCHINQIGFIQKKGDEVVPLQKKLIECLKKMKAGEQVDIKQINKMRKEIEDLSGFIQTKEGQNLLEESEKLLNAIDKLLVKKLEQLDQELSKEKEQIKVEVVKKLRLEIEDEKEFIRSATATRLYKMNNKKLDTMELN